MSPMSICRAAAERPLAGLFRIVSLRPLASAAERLGTATSSSPLLSDPVATMPSPLSLPCLDVVPIGDWVPDPVGSMEMGVPKSKITRSRKGKRNGPKFLKAVPVIARCRICGRVKLPHFFCCNGVSKEESSGE